jgi:heparan-alpha-glucosaminide N-acetyltransferase
MKTDRVLSIDIFRGLTIFLMVFVNDLAGVSNIPPWMKHVPPGVNGMTFVDVVFPAFLFIVGMAIPFAVINREAKGQSSYVFWRHVFTRTFGLLVLGIYMVNSSEMNREANPIPHSWWAALLYISAILIWNRYPKTDEKSKKYLFTGLRIFGISILIALFFLYRKGTDGQLTGMTPSWWGILGLIGWAYLLSIILYMASNKNLTILVSLFSLLLVILLGLRSNLVVFPSYLSWLHGQAGHFAHTLITLAGIICSLLLLKGGLMQVPILKIRGMIILGIMLGLAGYFTQPFGGISKIGATPAWALYSAAICCFVFPAVYWLVDIKGIKRWANFLKPAGENPLLTYILPPLFYAIVGFSYLPAIFSEGFSGFLRAVVFSLFILLIAGLLTKRGIRLHL